MRDHEPIQPVGTGPLGSIPTIKMKWSIIIVAAVAVTAIVSQIGFHLGWPTWIRPVISAGFALAAVQFLAHGMTSSLREMASAAKNMAKGNYRSRIAIPGGDEVGQLAVAFNQMAADLEAKDRFQKEFIANASNGLRSPVLGLTRTLQQLVDGVGRPDRETIGQMVSQSEHLSRLVEQLLNLSTLESGEEPPTMAEVDVGDVLHQMANNIRRDDPLALIDIKAPLGLRVMGDVDRLQLVFTNLVDNANRFSPHGSRVTVTASRQNGSVRVAIRDLGPGIAPEHREDVFKRFWQQRDGSPASSTGAGLGLSIAKHVVDQHGGEIAISDNQPTGTCVVVSLPRLVTQPGSA